MLLRNQTNTHRPHSEKNESRKALEEIAQVLGLPDSQPVSVL